MNDQLYDYIVVGHGLAGSVLSYLLIKDGNNVLVIDEFQPGSSSQVAAGLVNPVTGRRVVKSWMADTLLPFANDFYHGCEEEFGIQFYHHKDVLEVIHSIKDLNEWTSRMDDVEMRKYASKYSPEEIYTNKIIEFKKLFRINSSGWLDIPLFIEQCKGKLLKTSSILEEKIDLSQLILNEGMVEYKKLHSKRIIFSEGYRMIQNPLWKDLPLLPAKGEILTIECIGLPDEFILMSGIFLIPIGESKFRVGSTYEWNFTDELPTQEGKGKLQKELDKFLKIPYAIIDHRAGVRPTVKDRRPLIGRHKDHENVFIFNGMGTKGVVLAPYFADHFIKFLNGKEKLMQEVDVQRFKK